MAELSLDRENPLFERVVLVTLAGVGASGGGGGGTGGRASSATPLTLRVLSGFDASPRPAGAATASSVGGGASGGRGASAGIGRCVALEVCDGADPSFLHWCAIGEGDYAELAQEQSLLVGFSAFPAKLVELLEACAAPAGDGAPKCVSRARAPRMPFRRLPLVRVAAAAVRLLRAPHCS